MAGHASERALLDPRPVRASDRAAALLWATAALYLSVVPTYAARLLATHDLALLGALAALVLGASSAAQLGAGGVISTRVAQPVGLVLLALGVVALVLASPLGSLLLLIAAAGVGGVGHGLGGCSAPRTS